MLAAAAPSTLPSASTAASVALRSLAAVLPRAASPVASGHIAVGSLSGGRIAAGRVVAIAVWCGFARWRRRGVGVGSGVGLRVGRCRLEVWIGIRRNIRSRAATRLAAPATG